MKEILIIDDDAHVGNVLEEILMQEGYGVSRAYSGTEALLFLAQRQPDLILLDLMLPGLDGEEVLPQIKTVPVIILSAKVDMDNKVNLLLEGAVDYVMKPFNTKELLARIAVQFRKSATNQTVSKLMFDDIILDLHQCTTFVSEVQVKLTRTEYAILKLLMQHPNQVMTRAMLLEQISDETPDCTEASLKIHVSNLRKKLRQVNDKNYIEAVWGIGFKLKTE